MLRYRKTILRHQAVEDAAAAAKKEAAAPPPPSPSKEEYRPVTPTVTVVHTGTEDCGTVVIVPVQTMPLAALRPMDLV